VACLVLELWKAKLEKKASLRLAPAWQPSLCAALQSEG
jgi:hypothetical protein